MISITMLPNSNLPSATVETTSDDDTQTQIAATPLNREVSMPPSMPATFNPSPPLTPAIARQRANNWTQLENITLSKAWLYASENSIPGSEQRGLQFWSTVHDRYSTILRQEMHAYLPRTIEQLKIKWRKNRYDIEKFCKHMVSIEQQPKNGSSTKDIVAQALEIYRNKEGKPFQLFEAYQIVSASPKFLKSYGRSPLSVSVSRHPLATHNGMSDGSIEAVRQDVNGQLSSKAKTVERPMDQKKVKETCNTDIGIQSLLETLSEVQKIRAETTKKSVENQEKIEEEKRKWRVEKEQKREEKEQQREKKRQRQEDKKLKLRNKKLKLQNKKLELERLREENHRLESDRNFMLRTSDGLSTSQKAWLASEQQKISDRYKENDNVKKNK